MSNEHEVTFEEASEVFAYDHESTVPDRITRSMKIDMS